MTPPGSRRKVAVATLEERPSCCPHFHRAVELVGKRWTGAILYVLLESGRPLRFSEIGHAVPARAGPLRSGGVKGREAGGVNARLIRPSPPT